MRAPGTGWESARAAFAEAAVAELVPGLGPVRAEAARRAAALGWPTTAHEEWKFTNVAPILKLDLQPARAPLTEPPLEDIAPFDLGLDCYRVTFVDGHFSEALSVLPKSGSGIQAGSLADLKSAPEAEKHLARHAKFDENFFTALNTAYFQDGAFVSVPAGRAADKPVHLLFLGVSPEAGTTSFPRALVVAGKGASVKVIESHVSLAGAARFTCAVTELVLAQNAQVEHCKIQRDSEEAYHVAAVQAVLERDSHWTSHSISLGARLARNQVQALFSGLNGVAVLNGLYMADGEQLVDHHTVVDHATPHCESHEYYHGVMADRAHGVFNGKIFVRKDAQKTNAKQTNRNLLLSDNAQIDTKPQLEIFADDVKCTHGATVGQLSDEALFYLQSRGIGRESARRMLIQAFASDVVGRISLEPVKAGLEAALAKRFQPARQ